MKVTRQLKSLLGLMFGGAIVISGANHAFAQSIGFNFTTNGNWSGLNDNAGSVSLAPAEVAGVYPQSHWNNLGRFGSVNPGVVTNSAGNPVSLALNWDAPSTASTGAATNLNTSDGKLMDGFTFSWGPGPATAPANSVYSSANNNKPLIYISGLTAWINSLGASGFKIVVYASGYSYYETGEYWVQSITGSPFNNTMTTGADLTPHYFVVDSGPYTGSYVNATGTSTNTATVGANYVEFTGLTNDAVLIRNAVPTGYGSGVNGFQLVPIYPPNTNATVTVNVSSNLAVVPATGYGIHTSVYAGIFGDTSLPGALSRGGISTLRYPGGGYADIFHWSVSRPALGQNNGFGFSPWWGQSNNYGWMSPNTDFGSFVKLLTNAQCQALITVNFGAGQKWSTSVHTNLTIPTTNAEPPEAAAWVAYANASTNIFGTTNDVTLGADSQGNDWKTAGYWARLRAATPLGTDDGYNFLRIGRKTPIGIQYWEIGNENFGAGYYGGGNGYCLNYAVPYPYTTYPRSGNTNLSPAAYGKGVKSFSLLMKQVDPTIKIGAVVSTPPGDYSWDSYNGQHWTPQVLAQCATNIDFVIAHSYQSSGTLDDGSQTLPIPGSLYPAMVNGTGSHTGNNMGLKDQIAAYRTDATNVQIFISEFGYSGSLTNSIDGQPIKGPVNALFVADSYATWLGLGVANVDFLEMSTDTFLETVATPGGVYYAVQLTRVMAGAGDQLVSAASDTAGLRAHAAVQQSGKIGVLLLNDNRTSSLTVNVSIPNVSLAGSATQIQFGTNNFSGGSNIPAAPPTSNTLSISGNSVSVTLPAYTMSVLTIPVPSITPPAAPTGLAALAGDGVVALSWSASATATNYFVKRSPTSGSGYTTIATNASLAFTNTGLNNGTLYIYVVSAMNGSGESDNSAEVSARPTSFAPTLLGWTNLANQLRLNWPADHTGWRLQSQTNSLAVGLGTNWVNVFGSDQTNQVLLPLNTADGAVFLRLLRP